MKILVLAAMDKEINLLLDLLQNPEELQVEDIKVWKGTVGNKRLFVGKCGIGKVNSALTTDKLLRTLSPDIVINSGVAGGAGTPIGEVIVADNVTYHDVWCGPGTAYGQADGLPLLMKPSEEILAIAQRYGLKTGQICSGDKFISTADEIKFIREKFPEVKAVDMESASIAQTCILNGIPFAIVRVVSDTPGEGENINQYKDFWENAPKKTFAALTRILQALE